MGSDSSKIDPAKMPDYYVSDAYVTAISCELLKRSLRNIIGHISSHKSDRIHFLKFYETFFARLDQIQTLDCRLEDYLEMSLDEKSLFLVKLLNTVVLISSTINAKSKLDTKTKKQLKEFCKDTRGIKLECFGKVGEALFYSMEKCDEMYQQYITQAWITAYSLFLRYFIPAALRIRLKYARKSGEGIALEEKYDMSSDTSSDASMGDYSAGEEEDLKSRSGSANKSLLHQLQKRRFKRKKLDSPFDRSHSPGVSMRKKLEEIWDNTNLQSSPKRAEHKRRQSWVKGEKEHEDSHSSVGLITRYREIEHANPNDVRPLAIRMKRKSLTLARKRLKEKEKNDADPRVRKLKQRRHSAPSLSPTGWDSHKN